MEASSLIYLANVCDSLKVIAFIAVVACGAAFFFGFLFSIDENNYIKLKTLAHLLRFTLPISLFLLIVIPDKTTIYMMAAAKMGQQIAKSPEASEMGAKVLKLINEKLDEEIAKGKKK